MKVRYVLLACAVLMVALLALGYAGLRGSLPQLDGQVAHAGVTAPVSIERDDLGVPTIEAADRTDLAYGTGFVHGQDRFFQMDLSRRLAAGELSALFGPVAVEQDARARLFQFRQVARRSLQMATPGQRAALEAYARGVNAGLASLTSRPWEYWLLRSPPQPWAPEDTMLVTHAMWWDLQYSAIDYDIQRQRINARLKGADCEGGWKCALQFLYPRGTAWDAPNSQSGMINAGPVDTATVAVPSPEVLDVRRAAAAANGSGSPTAGRSRPVQPIAVSPTTVQSGFGRAMLSAGHSGIGSNNWVVSGQHSSTGAALVANDMHLTARVPVIWYRARLRLRAPPTGTAATAGVAVAAGATAELTGVTLPGTPALVAGSNGHVAWGFTNSYGNWVHVEKADCSSANDSRDELIEVHGAPAVHRVILSGPAGVLYAKDADGQSCWFVSWLAQLPEATNLNLMSLEQARSVNDVLGLAPTFGLPHQNLVVGDEQGHIAWTIAGRIPLSAESIRITGAPAWIDPASQPRIVDPEVGFLWSANARATDDPVQQQVIGGAKASVGVDYDLGARARQIRDDLLALKAPATPADMLHIQLDSRALFLTRWQQFTLALLDAQAVAGHPQRAEFRRLLADWDAQAGVDSVGYRLLRAYHDRLDQGVWAMLLGGLDLKPDAEAGRPEQLEGAVWTLVHAQPMHLLAAEWPDWKSFMLAQLDDTLGELATQCPQLARCTWGERTPVRIRHPLSRAVSLLSGFLDMPERLLPGDHYMPRVQEGSTGASERFAVSPGHEDQGYIHLPGGQSGHPLSPYYRAGFQAWADGQPLPFLPGATRHRLTLAP